MGRAGTQLKDKALQAAGSLGSKEAGALLAWIQRFAPFGVITLDESFHVKTWNHWMELSSSRRMQEVVGKELFDLFPDLRQRQLAANFERALNGESSVLSTGLHRYLLPLPSPFPETGHDYMRQTARISPLFSEGKACGIVVVIEDVTQREIQAEALRRQHRRDEILSWALAHLLKAEEPRKTVRQLFFKIAEHLDFDSFSLYLRDSQNEALSLHATGGLPTGAEKDFTGFPLDKLCEPAANNALVLDSVQSRLEPEYAVLKRTGVRAVVAVPLFANDRNLGLLCFGSWSRATIAAGESDLVTTIGQYLATALDRENTSRQLSKAMEQLDDHARLLEKRVEERTSQLQASVSELETFTYTLAHDLKAPIRGMNGYCSILLDDLSNGLSPQAHQIVTKLARASSRMEALVRDLLTFSRVSQQQVVLAGADIEPILEDVLAMRAPEVRQALTIQKPLHSVMGNKDLLQQVLGNLIDNAYKFVDPQSFPKITIYSEIVPGVSPSTRPGTLLFNAVPTTQPGSAAHAADIRVEQVRIWIVDQGIGIPRELHQKIFGIFERGVTSELYEGTGMGLAIVSRAVQLMSGTCGVESEPGKGSRFWLDLPPA